MKKMILLTTIILFSHSLYSAAKAPSKEKKSTDNPTLATNQNTGKPMLKDAKAAATSMMSMQQEIQKLSTESLNCKKTSDCDTLPIGHKLCGGPKSFVIASKTSPNFSKLKELTKKYSTQAKAFNKSHKKGMFGTCSVVVAPPVECKANLCKSKIVSFNK